MLLVIVLDAACRPGSPPPARVTTPDPATPFSVWEAGLPDLEAAMAAGRVTSAILVDQYSHRITAYDQAGPALNTMIRLNANAAAEAAALDEERKTRGPRGPLHGIPIVLKDNYDTGDMPTSAGSISLAGFVPGRDGFLTARLRAAGAVVVGKTNLMEFAMGITTLSSLGGQTRNAYDPSRYPGGSSGGTAAAVAASLAAVGWGTDTCGSIRVPAAFNALVGLRPTKGITSTQGIVPLSSSQDVSGPLARTMTDLAIALDETVSLDQADPAAAQWTARSLPRFRSALDANALRGARLGVLQDYFGSSATESEVSTLVHAALARMQQAGATVVDVALPGIEAEALAASVIPFEFRDDLGHYLAGHPTAPVRSLGDILQRGLYLAELEPIYTMLNDSPGAKSPGYQKAVAARGALRQRLQQTLAAQKLDALVYPTVRRPANLIGDPQTDPNCEASANSGFPALTVPAGATSLGLPVGMELLGAPLTDARLVAIGFAWEQLASPRQPPPYTPPLTVKAAPPPEPIRVTIGDGTVAAVVDFTFDGPSGHLDYTLTITGLPAADLLAVSLHQAAPGRSDGPVISAMAPPGTLARTAQIALPVPARRALRDGLLYVTLQTRQQPGGTLRGTLRLAASASSSAPPRTP